MQYNNLYFHSRDTEVSLIHSGDYMKDLVCGCELNRFFLSYLSEYDSISNYNDRFYT